MRKKLVLFSVLLFTLLFIAAQTSPVRCTSSDDSVNSSWTTIQNTFMMMQDTYASTGSVPQVDVNLLNQAIANASLAESLVSSNSSQSQFLALQANSTAYRVSQDLAVAKAEGLSQIQTNNIVLGAFVVVLLALAVVIYRYGSVALWGLCVRLRKDYNVNIQTIVLSKKEEDSVKGDKGGNQSDDEKDKDGEDDPLLTMDNISKIIAVLLVLVAVVAIAYPFVSGRTGEQFSELGVLGPSQTMSGYPSEVVSGSSVNLYLYVGNNLDTPAWYSVMAKVGDNSTQVDPAPAAQAVTQTFELVLLPGENSTFPVNITLTNVGANQRLIFELWQFNSTTGTFQYTHLWDQLWLSVTAKPT